MVVEEKREEDVQKEKLQHLKDKKKRCIKKMRQRTSKGQPVMRNYIKYALTKLEETIQKERVGHHQDRRH